MTQRSNADDAPVQVVTHTLVVERADGERVNAHVMVVPSDSAALVYGDWDYDELTLAIQVRCPNNYDVLGLDGCDCVERYERGMNAVSSAVLGMFVYVNVNDDGSQAYFDLSHFMNVFPNVKRVRLLNYTVAEAQILRESGYEVTHFTLLKLPEAPRHRASHLAEVIGKIRRWGK